MDAISKNTGYKSEKIQKCKNHLFYDTHRLDPYEALGEPVEIKDSTLMKIKQKRGKGWKKENIQKKI